MVATAAHHGIFPWNEPQRRVRSYANPNRCYGEDTKEQILTCLSCSRDMCNNCIEKNKHKKTPSISVCAERRVRIRNQIVELKKENLTIGELCKRVHISRTTYYSIIREGV